MKKILYLSPHPLDLGGAESIIFKIYARCVEKNVQFHFAVFSHKKSIRDSDVYALGGKIHYLGYYSILRCPVKRLVTVYRCVKNGDYDTVLMGTQYPHYSLCLLVAKFAGAKTLALRSTNADTDNWFLKCLNKYDKFLARISSNVRFAPSELAADYLFGDNSLKKYNVHLLKNGIDTSLFSFGDERRCKIRRELCLENRLVIGHVGRLEVQKNHKFLLEIFSEIVKIRDDAVLVMVGKGDLKGSIVNYAKDLEISEKIIFTGIRKDVPDCLMSMDVMVFPSFFEGMPNAVIEAQATGLPCLVSDTVTKECRVTDIVEFLSLKQSPKVWAEKALQMVKCQVDRKMYAEKMRLAGYDITDVADEFLRYMFP